MLEYAEPVVPAAVLVHETYNPGALVRVTAFKLDGEEVEVWKGRDPTTPADGKGVSEVKFDADFKTNRVKLYIDSKAVPGWNEIDAVGLRDAAGKTHWATSAAASSTYAEQGAGGVIVLPLPAPPAPALPPPPAPAVPPPAPPMPAPAPPPAANAEASEKRIKELEAEVTDLKDQIKALEERLKKQDRWPSRIGLKRGAKDQNLSLARASDRSHFRVLPRGLTARFGLLLPAAQ